MAKAQTVLTSQEALELIKKAADEGKVEISFEGLVFEDFVLTDCEIPISLNCVGATFKGPFNLCRSKFRGAFIDLEKATLKQGICLNGLESLNRLGSRRGNGYSLYLRNTKVWGDIKLEYTTLNWLCFEGIRHYKLRGSSMGQILTKGSTISRGISFKHDRF